MKLLLLLGLLPLVWGYYYDEQVADHDFLIKQKKILNLFYHNFQPSIIHPELRQEGLAYSILSNIDSYTNKDAVNHFLELYDTGLLPMGQIASMFYPTMITEMRALFKLFYYAKDFDTFYKTVAWARVHVNECYLIHALTQAIVRRPDTQFIQLPAIYEVYPYAFFNADVIEAAKNIKLVNKIDTNEAKSFIIRTNHTGWYINREFEPEMKLRYFSEDFALNCYYFIMRNNNPFWLSSEEFDLDKEHRGEEFFYIHKSLYNRYNLELLANGLDPVEDFDWHSEFIPGYYPTGTYHNGIPYAQRPKKSKIPNYKYTLLSAVQKMESRVCDAIDLGYIIDANDHHVKIYSPEGLNILGNLIEGNEDSLNKNYYGSIETFARRILGFNVEPITPYIISPSSMESLTLNLRDPAFYRLWKRILHFYYMYKEHQGPYLREEIVFPGLKIESVAVDKLLTYFEEFDTAISAGLPVASQQEAENIEIKVRQPRLNHKHFSIHFGIHSDKAQKVAIQLFLGPKYDAHGNLLDFSDSYKLFYEMDYWITDVHEGNNKLERNSHDFFFLMDDREPTEFLYKRVQKALNGTDKFMYKENVYGFPERLLLPKGRRGGAVFQLFVYVSPATDPVEYKSRVFGSYLYDSKPMGRPLDRPIYRPHFKGPNFFLKDVTIYFKSEVVDSNATI